MYNNDSNSLNAGAPDIRLSGNQQMASLPDPTAEMNDFSMKVFGKPLHQLTPPQLEQLYELMNEQAKAPQQDSGIMAAAPTGTYTQQRKQMMAGGGIAGLKQIGKPGGLVEPGISKYGMFDFITEPLGKLKDKFVDDIIPNEIKENPLATAALIGGGINQFGIPGMDGAGQNWLGELLGKDLVFGPGGEQYSRQLMDPTMMMGQLGNAEKQAQILAQGGYPNPLMDVLKQSTSKVMDPSTMLPQLSSVMGDDRNIFQKGLDMARSGYDKFTDTLGNVFSDTERDGKTFNWKIPVAAGIAAGKYTAGQPRDTLPIDQTGINFQTAQEAMDDPNLRFKPKLEDTQLAAQGGRIGYQDAGDVDPEYNGWKKIYETNPGLAEMHDNHPKYLERYKSETPKMAEGGLMNLGGMEKDYRNEGGFVALGGEEKADDVPARLSKNEFVFTADAVRGAGGGDIDQGAEIMENMMKHLEAGGEVSEDSQGLEGARGMFANAQQLQKRII